MSRGARSSVLRRRRIAQAVVDLASEVRGRGAEGRRCEAVCGKKKGRPDDRWGEGVLVPKHGPLAKLCPWRPSPEPESPLLRFERSVDLLEVTGDPKRGPGELREVPERSREVARGTRQRPACVAEQRGQSAGHGFLGWMVRFVFCLPRNKHFTGQEEAAMTR